MGTNYYARPKASDELKYKIIQKVVEGDLGDASYTIPAEFHLGKSSAGWQFLFNHNDWSHFEQSRESLEQKLETCTIRDEYYRPVSPAEFWEMVESKSGYQPSPSASHKDGLNFSDYTEFS